MKQNTDFPVCYTTIKLLDEGEQNITSLLSLTDRTTCAQQQ